MKWFWQKESEKDVHDLILSALYEFRNDHKTYDLVKLLPNVDIGVLRTKAKELEDDKLIKVVPLPRISDDLIAGIEPAINKDYRLKVHYRKRKRVEAKILPKGIKYVKQNHLPEKRSPFRWIKTLPGFIIAFVLPVLAFLGFSNYHDIVKAIGHQTYVAPPTIAVFDICPRNEILDREGFGILYYSTLNDVHHKVYSIEVCTSLAPADNVKIKFLVFSKIDDKYAAGSYTPHFTSPKQLLIDTTKLLANAKVRLEFRMDSWDKEEIKNVYVLGYGSFTDEQATHDIYILKKYTLQGRNFIPAHIVLDERERVHSWYRDYDRFNIP